MGNDISKDSYPWSLPHLRGLPDSHKESKYDPLYGFPNGRKKRESIATFAEMESAQLPDNLRDYCAHYVIKLMACRRDNFPFWSRCRHYRDMWDECEYQDEVLRMKEYERERRLDARQKRIKAKLAAEAKELQ